MWLQVFPHGPFAESVRDPIKTRHECKEVTGSGEKLIHLSATLELNCVVVVVMLEKGFQSVDFFFFF